MTASKFYVTLSPPVGSMGLEELEAWHASHDHARNMGLPPETACHIADRESSLGYRVGALLAVTDGGGVCVPTGAEVHAYRPGGCSYTVQI